MDRITQVRKQIADLTDKLNQVDSVLSVIVYGSFSGTSDYPPTKYSDIDLEIVVRDNYYSDFVKSFRDYFEKNVDHVLIETSVSHLQKIFVTYDFVDWQFHISKFSDLDNIDDREINYFINSYDVIFDKTGSVVNKIEDSVKPISEIDIYDKLNKLNNSFWYFVQGTAPFIKRREYWFAAAGYWAWLFIYLCKLLRIYYDKEVQYNPMKHIETALPKDIIHRIEPLRNLEKDKDLKEKMNLIIQIYSEYIKKVYTKNKIKYNTEIENLVRKQIKQYLVI